MHGGALVLILPLCCAAIHAAEWLCRAMGEFMLIPWVVQRLLLHGLSSAGGALVPVLMRR